MCKYTHGSNGVLAGINTTDTAYSTRQSINQSIKWCVKYIQKA